MVSNSRGLVAAATALLLLFCSTVVSAGPPNRASDFDFISDRSHIVVMPPDIELSELTAGGVEEPKADWTQAALQNVRDAVAHRWDQLAIRGSELPESDAERFSEISGLHAAVAQSIQLHHLGAGRMALPTKAGRLDWSLGDAVKPIGDSTGADYALFIFMRDSYASAGRKVTAVALALFGVMYARGPTGLQQGYASLVDLHTGQVVWFNALSRRSGDLRDAKNAGEAIDTLLTSFPLVQ